MIRSRNQSTAAKPESSLQARAAIMLRFDRRPHSCSPLPQPHDALLGQFRVDFLLSRSSALWFTLHLRTHHDRRRSYGITPSFTDPAVLLDGILGAVPYLVVAAAVSGPGAFVAGASGKLRPSVSSTSGGATPDLGWESAAKLQAALRPLGRTARGPRRPSPETPISSSATFSALRCAGSSIVSPVFRDEPTNASCRRPPKPEKGAG